MKLLAILIVAGGALLLLFCAGKKTRSSKPKAERKSSARVAPLVNPDNAYHSVSIRCAILRRA